MVGQVLFKVEQKRVLVPVGIPCPFGCKYCYTRGGEVGRPKVSPEDILSSLQLFAREVPFETIQFGYDGDPFAYPEHGLAMLKQLAKMGKNVNFSTKAMLTPAILYTLATIHCQMQIDGVRLSALISLSCWDSAPQIEPHTPPPVERIRSVLHLRELGIPVFIAVRPILPHIADIEYERIAVEGVLAGCSGFILGPLYTNDRGQFTRFIPKDLLKSVPSQKGTVSWSPHSPLWTRYEDKVRRQRIIQMIEKRGGRVFLSSADAMTSIYQSQHAA